MKFCGTKSPGLIVTNSSTVRLDYHTEEEGLSNGWSLQYSTHGEEETWHFHVSSLKLFFSCCSFMFGCCVLYRGEMSTPRESDQRQDHSWFKWILSWRLDPCHLWPRIQVDDGNMTFHCLLQCASVNFINSLFSLTGYLWSFFCYLHVSVFEQQKQIFLHFSLVFFFGEFVN